MKNAFTQAMIDQATEVKDTRDDGYVAANVSDIAPGGWFKTGTYTAKGLATEVTLDCEHDSSIGVVVRWYEDGSRRVRFEQHRTISRATAEAEIAAAVSKKHMDRIGFGYDDDELLTGEAEAAGYVS